MGEVLVIGIPKSGNNMVEKACRLLGVSHAHHQHTANYHLAEDNKVAYVYRNPRNVLVSAARYRNHQRRGSGTEITESLLVDVFYDFFNAPLFSVYDGYKKWLDSSACILKYEDFVTDSRHFDRLADYLGVKRNDGFSDLFGETYTWTGETSDWTRHWTDKLDEYWRLEGMDRIEKEWGYGKP